MHTPHIHTHSPHTHTHGHSGLPPVKLLGTRSNHQRGASLQISMMPPPDLKTRPQKEICSSPKLHLPEIKDATTCVSRFRACMHAYSYVHSRSVEDSHLNGMHGLSSVHVNIEHVHALQYQQEPVTYHRISEIV